MALLSISIDLSGSTYVKQVLVENSVDDSERRKKLYAEFLKLFYGIEREFYISLLNRTDLDFSKLFLVKSIGDEYWYVYEVDEDDETALARTAWVFFEVLIALFASERYFSLDGGDRPLEAGSDSSAVTVIREFDLPIKCHVDLIKEPIEVNLERYEYLKDIASIVRGDESAVYRVDQEFIELCNRLNLGSADILGDRSRVSTRTDYIGLEVDRFFRVAQFCKPLILCVGQALMDKLNYEIEPAAPGLEHINVKVLALKVPNGPDDGWSTKRKYVISEVIPAAMMRGIGESYTIYHLFGRNALGEAIHGPLPSIETLMEQTRAFLAEHGFYALDREHFRP